VLLDFGNYSNEVREATTKSFEVGKTSPVQITYKKLLSSELFELDFETLSLKEKKCFEVFKKSLV
jgi:hypothetical protein